MGVRETFAMKVGVPLVLLKERMKHGVAFNPLSADLAQAPHPIFHGLRRHDPVHRSELLEGWVLTRYEDVVSVLKDSRFSADRHNIVNERFSERLDFESPLFKTLSRSMLLVDPPDHTRLRTLVSKAFTPRNIEAMRGRIEEIVRGLLDDAGQRGGMDIIADLAYPLPVVAIAEILGIPAGERATFKKLSDDLVSTLDFNNDPSREKRANDAALALIEQFREAIRARRAEPREDLISAMLAVEEQGQTLTEDEMLGTCILLLVAGHETTTNLIGNGVLTLLQHPDQLRLLQSQPELLDSAIEEMLRYEYPVQSTLRIPLEDLELGGKQLRKGEIVLVIVGAANRDPEVFADSDRFDIQRSPNRHVAFGHGIHFCLGAPLARLEARIAIGSLLERFPRIRMRDSNANWSGSTILRGLATLPVTLS